jgi:hypothetical protein
MAVNGADQVAARPCHHAAARFAQIVFPTASPGDCTQGFWIFPGVAAFPAVTAA